MAGDIIALWKSLQGKVDQRIAVMTRNCVKQEKVNVVTAPDGEVMGVASAQGKSVGYPYNAVVAAAKVGDAVIIEWRDSKSNARVVAWGDGSR